MIELLIELLENFEWYHSALTFAVIFILVFKTPLGKLILRIKSINKSGIKIANNPEVQKEIEKKEAASKLLKEVENSALLEVVGDKIKLDLEERNLETTGDTIDVLIKHLAATQISLEFEQIYFFIFGSQILLLKRLNEVRGYGIDQQIIQSHLNEVKNKYPENLREWTLEQYLTFLIRRELIFHKDGRYYLGDIGVEYLTWMARNGRLENKEF